MRDGTAPSSAWFALSFILGQVVAVTLLWQSPHRVQSESVPSGEQLSPLPTFSSSFSSIEVLGKGLPGRASAGGCCSAVWAAWEAGEGLQPLFHLPLGVLEEPGPWPLTFLLARKEPCCSSPPGSCAGGPGLALCRVLGEPQPLSLPGLTFSWGVSDPVFVLGCGCSSRRCLSNLLLAFSPRLETLPCPARTAHLNVFAPLCSACL